MAKAPLIFKIKFTLPTQDSRAGAKNAAHINYIATRPGVDKELTEEDLVKDLDLGFSSDENYMKYIYERPGSHGLFGIEEKQPDLKDVQDELRNHEGIVWRAVISMREDDAITLGYLEKEKWMQSLRSRMSEITKEMGISESNLKWVAAFHKAKGHPHVHVVFWEKEPERTKGVLSRYERINMKRILSREFYHEDRERLGRSKSQIRKYVLEKSRGDLDIAAEIAKNMKVHNQEVMSLEGKKTGMEPKLYEQQEYQLAQRLMRLSEKMPGKGRVALKLMPDEVKKEVKHTSDWLLSQLGFKLETEKFMTNAEGFARHYTKNDLKIKEARERAYADLRNRVAQIILRKAREVDRRENSLDFCSLRSIKTARSVWKNVWRAVKLEQHRQEIEVQISKKEMDYREKIRKMREHNCR